MKEKIGSNWQLLVLALFVLTIVWPTLLPGYFSHHDDLQVMRIFEMRRCLADLQIPCRWVPDMGYGNGFPLFNYYGVFPYYLGALLSYGLGFLGAAKALFFISLTLGTFSVYFLAKELFGKNVALASATLFNYTPYRALDSYVRGAVAESLALALVPLVLYFGYKLILENRLRYFLGLVFALAAFLTTHNIMTLFFTPLIILWIFFWLLKYRFKNIVTSIIAPLLGFGLAAFFLVPAFLEKNLVQTENLTSMGFNFQAHFVTVNQLFFSRFWGYGASVPGTQDTISFQIGWPHWVLVALSVVLLGYFYIRYKKTWFMYWLILVIYLFSILMTHNKATFIWERVPLLPYAQFPWRMLSITALSGSLLAGFGLALLNRRVQLAAIALVTVLTVVLNVNYFRPETFYPDITDKQKLSGQEWVNQQKASIEDYLPKGVVKPQELAPAQPIVDSGDAQITQFKIASNRFEFKTGVAKLATIEIPVFDFPGWTTYIDRAKVPHGNSNNLRRISLTLEPGEYTISGVFENTIIRKIANLTSLSSLVVLIIFARYAKNKQLFR